MLVNSVEKAIDDFLAELAPNQKIIVAFSGGKDSTALLYCLLKKTDSSRLKAVYINHQLQPEADDWAFFCRRFCEAHHVPFEEKQVAIENVERKGIEAVAREERYEALFSSVPLDGVLVTGHHMQDQAETILFNLFRGTGLSGLKAMLYKKDTLYNGKNIAHFRPLLKVRLSDLTNYLNQNQLDWIEDRSNEDGRFSRNYIRHQLLPLIEKKWPKYDVVLSRMSNTVLESLDLLDELAKEDLAKAQGTSFSLDLSLFSDTSWPRKKNLIRYWMKCSGLGVELNQAIYLWLEEMLDLTNVNAHPSRKLSDNCEIRVEKQKIYVIKELKERFSFTNTPVNLEALHFDEVSLLTHQVAPHWLKKEVVFRSITSKDFEIFPSLKKWLKSENIVYWNRLRWPVIEIDGEVAAVLGYITKDKFKS